MSEKHSHLVFIWEYVDDPDASKLLRRAVELILRDQQELSAIPDVDKVLVIALNEDIHPSNTNHTPQQS